MKIKNESDISKENKDNKDNEEEKIINVDENYEEEKNIKMSKDKDVIKGMFIGMALTLLIVLSSTLRSWINPLPNSKKIARKLNEMNFIIDKYNIYEKDLDYIEDMVSLGMMAGLKDKYANYYNKEDVKQLSDKVSGEYVGIGVLVIEDASDGYLVITRIYDNSPALAAGLKLNDKIIEIDDKSLANLEVDEVVSMVKGIEGTNVKIKVLRKEDNKEYTFNVIRKKLDTPQVSYNMIDNNIGYIKLDCFEGKAFKQMVEAKEELEKQGMKSMIIDLRNNPGGNLDVLLKISDLFLDKATITYFEDRDGKREYYYSKDGKWEMPVVLLVNNYTASAAEAFAGALQDNKRTKVIGTQTYGKGVVQEIFGLSDGAAIKFTVYKYFTPNGNEVNEKGITPDYVVEDVSANIDEELERAKQFLNTGK